MGNALCSDNFDEINYAQRSKTKNLGKPISSQQDFLFQIREGLADDNIYMVQNTDNDQYQISFSEKDLFTHHTILEKQKMYEMKRQRLLEQLRDLEDEEWQEIQDLQNQSNAQLDLQSEF